MQRHFDQDLAHLKQTLLRMGGLVESQIQQALQALVDHLRRQAKILAKSPTPPPAR